ncbi:MAG: purine biosynthesis protein PurH [Lachnospiraceae bacterium]|nr:purine biosynthesis protein PurH [Lachnospiraceae bacterium]
MSYLIKDTTREEREQIVADSIGNINGACDGCASGLAEMYQDYIDGKRELREINMSFRRSYISQAEGPDKGSCQFTM